MATWLDISPSDGYPTDTEVRVDYEFEVTYANNYEVKFELYNDSAKLIDESWKGPYAVDAGGTKSGRSSTFTDLDPESYYTIVGSLWNADTGVRLSIEEPQYAFVTASPEKPERPEDWEWWTTGIYSGGSMKATITDGKVTAIHPLTAREWLAFVYRIVEFYNYMGETVSDTYYNRAIEGVVAGSPMTATQANAARTLIRRLDPVIDETSRVDEGEVITAEFINGLAESLNSVSY